MLKINGNERVLISPLGWGLGHATRLIPIISDLTERGCSVVIAADLPSNELLRVRFPELEYIHFPSINIKLSRRRLKIVRLFQIAIRFFLLTYREHKQIKKLVKEYMIDIVISDNRYGLWGATEQSVLITHQLKILFPAPFKWAEFLGRWYVKRYAEKYTECWVPDRPLGFRFSGELSSPRSLPSNIEYIGIQSRFSDIEVERVESEWDFVGIVSGPPPQRDIFEQILISIANRLKLKVLIFQGLPLGPRLARTVGNATLVSHLPDDQMAQAIISAKLLICRSGYSTIMDLVALNRSAVIVPTPGQSEQEYLAKYLARHNLFISIPQSRLLSLTLANYRQLASANKPK
ncbi:glycosyltransferase [Perlabentimonas gracilis]|uniref:glycosyltransferase n=1 Tax=Perlabentimonas gracilis TaxID=2715279 RepID=UPI00140C0285|nr:glycosyltransferase [Perlabentimonas gracilis]NHB68016.1 hypothetical protein [Perlabentimonas gracilis]